MSHVSTTTHYGFPIYGDTDIINPLTDFNDCNTAIDNKLYEVAQGTAGVVADITDLKNLAGSETLDTASQTLTGAVNELKTGEDALDTRMVASESDVATLQAQMSTAVTNISNLGTSVAGLQTEMAGKASATALQTLTNKVGTGNLDTQAQNCVDAINEVLSKIPAGGSVNAEDVVYSNTTSGLTATDVQSAIDEIVGEIPNDASDVDYDNTTSGLTATTVQGAIDELASASPSSGKVIATVTGDGTKKITEALNEMYTALVNEDVTENQALNLKLIVTFAASPNPQILSASMYHVTNNKVDFVRFTENYYNSTSSWGTSILEIGATAAAITCPHNANAVVEDFTIPSGTVCKLVLI